MGRMDFLLVRVGMRIRMRALAEGVRLMVIKPILSRRRT